VNAKPEQRPAVPRHASEQPPKHCLNKPSQISLTSLLSPTTKTMDPFSTDGELVNIHTAFIQGQYPLVLSDYSSSDFSASNRLPVRVLQDRAKCALGQYDEVIGSISDAEARQTPDLAAVRTYASFLSDPSSRPDGDAVVEAERLADAEGENLTVQLLCGTVLARTGRQEQALQLLQKHQGSLDAVALMVQIHLSMNRTDLAVKEAKGARSFAQDALLVNLAESWIGVRQVGCAGGNWKGLVGGMC